MGGAQGTPVPCDVCEVPWGWWWGGRRRGWGAEGGEWCGHEHVGVGGGGVAAGAHACRAAGVTHPVRFLWLLCARGAVLLCLCEPRGAFKGDCASRPGLSWCLMRIDLWLGL